MFVLFKVAMQYYNPVAIYMHVYIYAHRIINLLYMGCWGSYSGFMLVWQVIYSLGYIPSSQTELICQYKAGNIQSLGLPVTYL